MSRTPPVAGVRAARIFFGLAALLAALAVAAGAFGAHALGARLDPPGLATFETAARYHMYHALALFAVAWAVERGGGRLAVAAGWLFVLGVAVFSGSLYALAVTGVGWLGAVTPVGGVALLVGWALLAGSVLRR